MGRQIARIGKKRGPKREYWTLGQAIAKSYGHKKKLVYKRKIAKRKYEYDLKYT